MASLTEAEVLGITGTEAALTTQDIEWAVAETFHGEIPEHEWGRGSTGLYGDRWLSTMTDRRGLWVRLDEYGPEKEVIARRAGHLPWSTAEQVIRAGSLPEQTALF